MYSSNNALLKRSSRQQQQQKFEEFEGEDVSSDSDDCSSSSSSSEDGSLEGKVGVSSCRSAISAPSVADLPSSRSTSERRRSSSWNRGGVKGKKKEGSIIDGSDGYNDKKNMSSARNKSKSKSKNAISVIEDDDDSCGSSSSSSLSASNLPFSAQHLTQLTGQNDLSLVSHLSINIETNIDSIEHLGEHMPSLVSLRLNPPSTLASFCDLGTRLTNLTILWIPRCGVSDLSGISGLPLLQELYFSFNDVEFLEELAFHEHLQVLDLEANSVQSMEQVEFLSSISELSSLTLAGCPVTNKFKSNEDFRRAVCDSVCTLEYLDDDEGVDCNYNHNSSNHHSSSSAVSSSLSKSSTVWGSPSAASNNSAAMTKDNYEEFNNDEDSEYLKSLSSSLGLKDESSENKEGSSINTAFPADNFSTGYEEICFVSEAVKKLRLQSNSAQDEQQQHEMTTIASSSSSKTSSKREKTIVFNAVESNDTRVEMKAIAKAAKAQFFIRPKTAFNRVSSTTRSRIGGGGGGGGSGMNRNDLSLLEYNENESLREAEEELFSEEAHQRRLLTLLNLKDFEASPIKKVTKHSTS